MKLVEQDKSEKFVGLKTEQEDRIKLVNRDQVEDEIKKDKEIIGEKND